MNQICKRSGLSFQITDLEQSYCEQRGIPLAEISPQERLREMFAFRNETTLHSRRSSLSGKEIVSIHRPNTVFPVFAPDEWLSENNDPFQYGRPYDFSRPFFEQFLELSNLVPREGQLVLNAENSPYVNINVNVKDCYYTFNCLNSQGCWYGNKVYSSRDCVDCTYVINCELCYECINCHDCYQTKWSQHSFSCRDSSFLYGCRSCSDCFGCVGLEHQQYCLWNVQYSKEEYLEKVAQIHTDVYSELLAAKDRFETLKQTTDYQYQSMTSCEDCDGAYLENCKSCHTSYIAKNCHTIEHSFNLQNCRDCCSAAFIFDGELLYRCFAMSKGPYHCQFCYMSPGLKNSQYCAYVFHSEYMFGCIGFPRRASYCILNKQYSQAEYEELLPKIIAHMKSTGEYGQFFPMAMSDFPYSDTVAQDYFPIDETGAKELQVHWDGQKLYPTTATPFTLADALAETPDSICEQVLEDPTTKRAYKLQKKELQFYRTHKIAIPRECFDSRNSRRLQALFRFP